MLSLFIKIYVAEIKNMWYNIFVLKIYAAYPHFKATPHKDCAEDAQLIFLSDCTEIPQVY